MSYILKYKVAEEPEEAVEAFRYYCDQTPDWFFKNARSLGFSHVLGPLGHSFTSHDGEVTAYPGKYIIKKSNGEMFQLSRDIFEKVYEKVKTKRTITGK